MPIDLADINAAMASAKLGGMKRRAAPKVRMATDNMPPDLDGLLKDIKEEGKEEALEGAIQDATVYLNRQYGIEDQFMAAGLSQAQARMVEALGELKGRGVPSAFIHSPRRGLEQRVHTRYSENPVTGAQEIVPFQVDGKTLVTNIGRGVPINGHDKATEYVQEQAMLLAGLPVERNNNTGNPMAPDFRVGNQLVDGEIRFDTEGNNIPVQLYTSITPSNSRGMSKYEVRDAVKGLISREMSKGLNIFEAVDSLSRNREVRNHIRAGRPFEGKLLKDKPGERIDQLIMPTLTQKEALANKKANDTIAIAPQNIRMVDLDAVNDLLMDMTRNEINRRTQIRANDGNNHDVPRGRVYARVDQNAPGVSYDLADRYPYAAQLYA